VRIDAIEFAGLDHRRDDCPMLAAAIRAREQSVLFDAGSSMRGVMDVRTGTALASALLTYWR
jgi:hypothetical protein